MPAPVNLDVRATAIMGESRTAEQILSFNKARMGEELGVVYSHLWQELAWLYTKWHEYVALFGTKPSRIDLVNNAAPYFFKVVQDALWKDVILHIARMTDPPKSVGKTNMTVQQLPDLVGEIELRNKLLEQIEIAKITGDFCRDWRNRRLAHRDLDLALGNAALELAPASRKQVRKALQALADILDAVSLQYCDATTKFDVVTHHGGAESLLYVMNDGLEAQKAKHQRMREGGASPDDYNVPRL